MAETRADTNKEPDTGAVTTHSARGNLHCITIIGTIEGHQEAPESTKTTKYEHVLPQLAAIEESDDIDGLLILLNTAGGDVEAGLAIAELIAGMHKPTLSLVLGGGHSIGIPLAVAAQRTLIAPSASMMLPSRICFSKASSHALTSAYRVAMDFCSSCCASSSCIRWLYACICVA